MSHSVISKSLSNYNKHGTIISLKWTTPKNHTNKLLKTTSQFRIDVVADLNINNDYSSKQHHFFRFAVIHAIDLMIVQIFPLQIPVFVIY